MINEQEFWEVEINGEIYETSLDLLAEWINNGSLLPNDKVRRKNLRWIEAGKIPQLYGFFNARDLGVAPPVINLTAGKPNTQPININVEAPVQSAQITAKVTENTDSPIKPQQQPAFERSDKDYCAIHNDIPPVLVCKSCENVFCKTCPSAYGSVKICPFCGEMCEQISLVLEKEKLKRLAGGVRSETEKFDFMDFANSVAFPFQFPASLIFGALMFLFFTIGQSVTAVAGMLFFPVALICGMLANTLTFGILSNTVNNMVQGKINLDFMPQFDDFSIWDDVVHPFFLSIGVYLISFGAAVIFLVIGVFFAISSLASQPGQPPSDQGTANNESLGPNSRTPPNLEKLLNQSNKNIQSNNEKTSDANKIVASKTLSVQEQEAEFNKFLQSQDQPDSPFSSKSQFDKAKNEQMAMMMLKNIGWLLIPTLLSLLWGLFYFPAACAVAGYTRSFAAVMNPSVGLDTIKRMGFEYFKVLFCALILLLFMIVINVILSIVFSPLNLPSVGNLPAAFVGSIFNFYFWIVYSSVLGIAVWKNAGRLNI